MLLGLCLTIAAVLACGIAAAATRPAGGARGGDLGGVTLADVAGLLLAGPVPRTTVDRVLDRARYRRITARTLWRWGQAHGASGLVLVLDAGLAEDTLIEYLDAGTAPDWAELEVFAGLTTDALPGAIPWAELLDPDVVPDPDELAVADLADWTTLSPDPLELCRFENLPPISGPGLTPLRPIASFDGDDDCPEAA